MSSELTAYALSEEQEALRDSARQLAEDKIAPYASRRETREAREAILAATPEQFAEQIESLLSPPDAEALTGDLARWLTEIQKDGLSAGDQGWWDDEVPHLTSWGSIWPTSGCPSTSGRALTAAQLPAKDAALVRAKLAQLGSEEGSRDGRLA